MDMEFSSVSRLKSSSVNPLKILKMLPFKNARAQLVYVLQSQTSGSKKTWGSRFRVEECKSVRL